MTITTQIYVSNLVTRDFLGRLSRKTLWPAIPAVMRTITSGSFRSDRDKCDYFPIRQPFRSMEQMDLLLQLGIRDGLEGGRSR